MPSGIRLCLLVFLLMPLAANEGATKESTEEASAFFLVPIHSKATIENLVEEGVIIRHRLKAGAVVTLDAKAHRRLLGMGFAPLPLPDDPALPSKRSREEESFHDNEDVDRIFSDIETQYPDIFLRYTLGYSEMGRAIHSAIISDNPGESEFEPEARVVGAHHGNELLSVEIPLELAKYLTEQYGTDERITALVDSTAIYITPIVNPDGRAGERRTNANLVDLNRNYGFQYNPHSTAGDYSLTGAYSQVETLAMAEEHFRRAFVVSFSFHTVQRYVNYLWNYTDLPSADEPQIITLSERYALQTDYVATNGFDWYQTYGDTNDFSYGTRGGIDWTIETPNEGIKTEATANIRGMLDVFEQMHQGIRGIVTNRDTGEPLHAAIQTPATNDPSLYAQPIYTDKTLGDYHRMLPEGDYSLIARAPGFEPFVVEGVTVSENHATQIDIELVPQAFDAPRYGFQIAGCLGRPQDETPAFASLFAPETQTGEGGAGFTMASGGFLLIDMLEPMSACVQCVLQIRFSARLPEDGVRVSVSEHFRDGFVEAGILFPRNDHAAFPLYELALPTGGEGRFRYVRFDDLGDSHSHEVYGASVDWVAYLPYREQTEDWEALEGDGDYEADEFIESESEQMEGESIETLESTEEEGERESGDSPELEWEEGEASFIPDGDEEITLGTGGGDSGCSTSESYQGLFLLVLLTLALFSKRRRPIA